MKDYDLLAIREIPEVKELLELFILSLNMMNKRQLSQIVTDQQMNMTVFKTSAIKTVEKFGFQIKEKK